MKITLHRALTELKTIDERIAKSIQNTLFIGSKKGEKGLVNQNTTETDFEKETKSKMSSITDLIDRKTKVKSAIVNANATTIVKINGNEMTIAEAIVNKAFISNKKVLVQAMKSRLREVESYVNSMNDKVEHNAINLAQAALQKDNVKIGDNDAVNITQPYIEVNSNHLVDPLNLKKQIEWLEEEILDFETEVDASLSEVNATTFIEI